MRRAGGRGARAARRRRSPGCSARTRTAKGMGRRQRGAAGRFPLRCRAMAETFLLVDGENIDATLGGSVLGRRPAPEERPRWDRVRDYVASVWEQPVRGLFFLNASGNVPMAFVQALTAIGLRPVLLSGPADVKVVDVAIERTLGALV